MTNGETEKRLWDVANKLRANSKLSSAEYSTPVLGLIFLRYADFKFSILEKEFEKQVKGSRRKIGKVDYLSKGIYLSEKARYSHLHNLPEGSDIGQAINEAMETIEEENPDLKGVLPKGYAKFDNDMLVTLLKAFSEIHNGQEGDIFGKIYEYFLGKFAMSEGQKGGEFFTPASLVKLIVEIIKPFHGKIFDPACGSGGMFIQSARFVEEHKKNPTSEISIYGQDKLEKHVNLCKMNLAIHGLPGDIKEANTYYEDVHNSVGKFDFIMANPPFNVHGVDYEKIKGDKRWTLGLPSNDNANYLWIQQFWTALNDKGRAGFVMANSAADPRGNEAEILKKLIKEKVIDVIVAVGPNFFYTVTLASTLWFLDKGKINTVRKDKILFIDARQIYRQIDRAHREFTPDQTEFISTIVRLCRSEKLEKSFIKHMDERKKELSIKLYELKSEIDTEEITKIKDYLRIIDDLVKKWNEFFPDNKYKDIKGLCKVATLKEIEEQGWSLNPGRYVGVAKKEEEDYDFKERLEEYNEELEELNAEARELEKQIAENVNKLLGVKK